MILYCLCSVIAPIYSVILNLPDSALVVRCTADDEEPNKKRKICKEYTTDSKHFVETMSLADNSQPLHIFSDLVEPETTTKRLTVAILLLSDVLSGEFFLHAAEDGCGLDVTMSWPEPLINLKVLNRIWLQSDRFDRIEKYYPKLIGFKQILTSHRARSSDNVKTTSRISFPFQIQFQISHKYSLAWFDRLAKLVYVELREQGDLYDAVQDNDSFEVY